MSVIPRSGAATTSATPIGEANSAAMKASPLSTRSSVGRR